MRAADGTSADSTPLLTHRNVTSLSRDGERTATEGEDRGKLFTKTESQGSEEDEHFYRDLDRRKVKYEKALFKQQYLLTEAGTLIRCFNMELRTLSHQKVNLDLLMKRATLNLLILYEEYTMLKEFEKSERGLAANYEKKITERAEVDQKVAETELEIEETLVQIERLTERENEIFENFKNYLGDNHKWNDFLHKVYKKKIKRKVKRTTEGGEDSESSSSSEDSEWNESDEEEEDDDMLDLDMCPPDCEQVDYDTTVAFRDQRLDVEDEIAEQRRLLEIQHKDAETLTKKSRAAHLALEQAASDLKAFQLEKQRKLNVLERAVTLRLDQITFFQDKALPADFSPVLIFKRENVALLKRRIQALEDEKRIQRKEKKQAKEKHLMLQRHKRVFQDKLQKMAIKCDLVMIDKFGRLENIEKLETISINPKIEEISCRVLALQARIQREENAAEERLREARDKYIVQMRENTRIVAKTLMVFNELQAYFSSMEAHRKHPNKPVSEGVIKENKELTSRIKVVQSQAEEINRLTAEIRCLSEKGPKILPPVQAPPNFRPVTN
uniref:WD_REPEATS_REGION domain-containing protein n=2 Tax=Mesocestoides corti TaxID=53468 RepID=A0A5K3F228_MESCO